MNERSRSGDSPVTAPSAVASSAVTVGRDWRADLLAGMSFAAPDGLPQNRLGWPGYDSAVAVRRATGPVAGVDVTAVVWDFAVYGGSFGERDADAFLAAAADAAARRRPLVSFLRSGGTRLQEGVAGLLGLPRVTLALRALSQAGVPHVAVVDHPTTGGVWVTVGSRADLRVAVAGATVGFAGPRVVKAVTGQPVPADSHTAAAAHAAGLVDAVVEPPAVADWLARALPVLDVGLRQGGRAGRPDTVASQGTTTPQLTVADSGARADRSGWAQVTAARQGTRPTAGELLGALVTDGVDLMATDRTVRARLGLLAAAPDAPGTAAVGVAAAGDAAAGDAAVAVAVVGVAVGAHRGAAPGPAGYRLLTRAARLAGRLGLPLVTLVDTPGADPSPAAEAAGIAAAIGEAMDAVLGCPSPTVGVVVGEGGSGGAIAAVCTDVLLLTADSYIAALSPEGVAATLRTTPPQAADVAGLRPDELLRLGVIDAVVPANDDLVQTVAATVRAQFGRNLTVRRTARDTKWSTAATGRL